MLKFNIKQPLLASACVLLSLVYLGLPLAHAQNSATPAKIARLVPVEINQLNAQERVIDQLARRYLGTQVHRDQRDLDMLQRMIERKVIKQDESAKLQAMGVVLGNLLEKNLNLDWMSYEDEVGYSRALCVPGTKHCLFPITMLSRRLEVGLSVDVKKIYANAVSIIDPYIPDTHGYDGTKPDPEEKPEWIKDDDINPPIKIRIQ